MKDITFKNLLHEADNFQIISTGGEISTGYKPDVVLRNGNDYIIMECDTGSTRKGFIGAMIKAAKFFTNEKTGILIFVIKEKKNTTVKQIQSHLTVYFHWIASLTNLKAIYLISTDNYCSVDMPVKLLDTLFNEHALKVERIVT